MCVIDWNSTWGRPIECSRRRSKPRASSITPPCDRKTEWPRFDQMSGRTCNWQLAPGWGVVHPAAADHRRDHPQLPQLLGLAREWVAVEHDEIGEAAGDERASHAFVVREPRGRDADCIHGVGDGKLFALPPVVERRREDAGPRVELLDRRVGAVGEERTRPEERAEGVDAVELVRPEALREVLVGG